MTSWDGTGTICRFTHFGSLMQRFPQMLRHLLFTLPTVWDGNRSVTEEKWVLRKVLRGAGHPL